MRRQVSHVGRGRQRWMGLLWLLLCTCAKSNGPSAGSETHFLSNCAGRCAAPYTCACGVCTLSCREDLMCAAEHAGASCSRAATREACLSPANVCDVHCVRDLECTSLGADFVCAAGRCREREGNADVSTADNPADGSTIQDDGGTPAQDGGSMRVDSGERASDSGTRSDDSGATRMTDGSPSNDVICDGSASMRLGLTIGGGQVDVSFDFTNPYGHRYLFVDGMCRYYLSTNFMTGIKTGSLSAADASELASAIGWSKLTAWSALPEDFNCPDGGTTTIQRPGAATSCSCGCDPSSPADRTAAFEQVNTWFTRLDGAGTALTGSVSAIAVPQDPAAGDELAWPLSRRMTAVTGLISQPGEAITTMARFDVASEATQLRTLRGRALMRDMFANAIAVSDAGTAYRLWVRDELPDGVANAISTLRGMPSSP